MPQNRISSYPDLEKIPTELSRLLRFTTGLESLFEGPQTLDALIREALENARRRGFQDAVEKMRMKTEEKLRGYLLLILKVGNLIKKHSEKEIPTLEIKQFRTRLDADSGWINLFFVINSSAEDEIKFSRILDNIELALLEQKNCIAEIFFVNEREKEVDYASIKNDYPFSFDLQKISK